MAEPPRTRAGREAPDPMSSLTAVYFGYGPPGLKGYEPTAHKLSCG